MEHERIYRIDDHLRPTDEADEPLRTVVTESEQAAVVAWIVLPGQRIASHVHPHGQDTWIVQRGRGEYAAGDGAARALVPGDIAIARTGDVHGVYNAGHEPFVFVSVVSPAQAGYERIADADGEAQLTLPGPVVA
jgi:quercetin dioxygenase-like cupin family protein